MAKTAWLNLRYTVPERREAFKKGLQHIGYNIREDGLNAIPRTGDIFVTWNRIGKADQIASMFQSHGLPVVVSENASWGNEFTVKQWYTLALNYHNTSGCFNIGGNERWDNLNVDLKAFKDDAGIIILPQRGIGSNPTVMTPGWAIKAQAKHGGTIRNHPGRNKMAVQLEQELTNYGTAITWGSGAAIKALMLGLSVKSDMPNWIGEQDNTEQGRLDMFRRLSWAQWTLEEISRGIAFAWVLS